MTVSAGEHDRQDLWTVIAVLTHLVGLRLLAGHEPDPDDVRIGMADVEERAVRAFEDARWRVKIRERKPSERLELLVDAEKAEAAPDPGGTPRDPMTALRKSRRPTGSAARDPVVLSGRDALRALCRGVSASHDPSIGMKRFAAWLARKVGVERFRGARGWTTYSDMPNLAAAEPEPERDWWAEVAAAVDVLAEPARSVVGVRLELSAKGWPEVVAELDRRGVRNSAGAPFTADAAKKLVSRLAKNQPLFGLLVNRYRTGESRAAEEAAEHAERTRARERREAHTRARQAALLLRDEDHELYVLLWAWMTEGASRSGEMRAGSFLGRHVPRQELLRRVEAFLSGLDELAARQLPLIELVRPRRAGGQA